MFYTCFYKIDMKLSYNILHKIFINVDNVWSST